MMPHWLSVTLQVIGALVVVLWCAIITFVVFMMSHAASNERRGRTRLSKPNPDAPVERIDRMGNLLRRRDAAKRGAIHHPFGDPVFSATVNELMPHVVEVPE